jgi:hypothetical protein
VGLLYDPATNAYYWQKPNGEGPSYYSAINGDLAEASVTPLADGILVAVGGTSVPGTTPGPQEWSFNNSDFPQGVWVMPVIEANTPSGGDAWHRAPVEGPAGIATGMWCHFSR